MQATIYMPLLNEGTDVWTPVTAEQIGPTAYRLLGPVPTDHEWRFGGPGDVVRVALHTFSDGEVGLAVIGPEPA